VSVDLDDRLVVFDTQVRAQRPPWSVLEGDDRDVYLACDAIADAGQLGSSAPHACTRSPTGA